MALDNVTSHFSTMLEPIASASFLSGLSIIHGLSHSFFFFFRLYHLLRNRFRTIKLKKYNKTLSNNDLHVTLQSAYKVFQGTDTSLLGVHNDILLALNKWKNVLLILLDLSVAFDTVNHSLFISKLQQRYS